MQDHWSAGYRDAIATLSHPEVLTPPHFGVEVYDFLSKPNVEK
jgi:hypothetical protein